VEIEVKRGPDDEMVGSTIGVISSNTYVTMNKLANLGETEDDRVVRHFRHILEFCPVGCHMAYITESEFLMEQRRCIKE
jgi:hypothetical protein